MSYLLHRSMHLGSWSMREIHPVLRIQTHAHTRTHTSRSRVPCIVDLNQLGQVKRGHVDGSPKVAPDMGSQHLSSLCRTYVSRFRRPTRHRPESTHCLRLLEEHQAEPTNLDLGGPCYDFVLLSSLTVRLDPYRSREIPLLLP